MNRGPDIMFMTEYIKNALYFATVRRGKTLKNNNDTHYFSIDNELVYENYYSDFGPLNLGCVYKYCKLLNEKINQFINRQTIVHYTSIDPKKKANAAFLIGCYGVLYLSLSPRDALRPLMVHGQSYRPFQDATQGDSSYTISLLDCLQAIKKARELGLFNFQDFNYEEYERLDKIQGGDLNWIVPGKFLAFIGPVDYSISLYHPPEMYLDYFTENNVRIVIRLNKRLYDANVFNNMGIAHYDLFFIDGSCPSRTILFKFLQISEEAECAIAVHCKAGLGRTGSLIGSYLIKHYKMTSHEAIGWMRICRPGSVIGHQQSWLEQLEPWLHKQGNIYRRHTCHDLDKLPFHEYGIYSISERGKRQRQVVFQKHSAAVPAIPNIRSTDATSPIRPQHSRIKEVASKATEKNHDWRLKWKSSISNNQKLCIRGPSRAQIESFSKTLTSNGEGDLRGGRPMTRSPATSAHNATKSNQPENKPAPIAAFHVTQAPLIRTVNDAKSFLMRSSLYSRERDKQLNSSVTSSSTKRTSPYMGVSPDNCCVSNRPGAVTKPSPTLQSTFRKRLGRSPSPAPRVFSEKNKATNTSLTPENYTTKIGSKNPLHEFMSRLKSNCEGSLGAASLGANRVAPTPRMSFSVRSDERPLATQGDMLNSIKFERRYREAMLTERAGGVDKNSSTIKKSYIKTVGSRTNNANANTLTLKPSNVNKPNFPASPDSTSRVESPRQQSFFGPSRPMSPKGRRNQQTPSFY